MDVRIDPEALDHNSATANLRVSGLSILHFNVDSWMWEVNFLRNPRHEFQLIITGNGRNETITVGNSLDIRIEDAVPPNYNQFPNGYWFTNAVRFDRSSNEGHDEDFRWVPDLADHREFLLHGRARRRQTLGSGIDSVITLELANVVFYTVNKTGYDLRLALANVPSPFPFGKTNETLGADIVCREGGAVVITVDRTEYRLPHVPNSPYTIELQNTDRSHREIPSDRIIGNFLKGDFYLYYELVDVTQPIGLTYDMVCGLAQFHSDDCDCNPGFVSTFADSN